MTHAVLTLPQDADASVKRLVESYLTLRPVDATFIGVHTHDHRMPDWSPSGLEALVEQARELQRARPGHHTAVALAAHAPSDVDLALLAAHGALQEAELSTTHFLFGNPALVTGEVAFAVIGLLTRDVLPAAQRASWLLQRLQAIPRFLAGALQAQAGAPVPAPWLARAQREAAATDWLLGEGLSRWIRAMQIQEEMAQALLDRAESARGALHAATEQMAQRRVSEDPPPCGEPLLDLAIRRGHWVEQSVDALLDDARRALPDARARLDEMAAPIGGVTVVLARLAERHPSAAGYYQAFDETWHAVRHAARDLVTWPETLVRYAPIPEWTREAAPSLYYLYYRSPAPLEPFRDYTYVVPPIDHLDDEAQRTHLRTWNQSVITLNHVIHHGALGHHVQNWHAGRAPLHVGRIAAADCASRIAFFLGGTMAEGWACYATDLMEEIGFLTAEERVAEQQTRVRMLLRAIVDLEFHTGRCTFHDAVAMYREVAGMPPAAAHGEVVKNSMFPGTASMYWLGTSGIHALRARAQERWGSAFSLRRFHDALLANGSVPVTVAGALLPDVAA